MCDIRSQVWKDHFQKIYSIQEAGHYFEDPESMLRALGLYDLTQKSSEEYLMVRNIDAIKD